MIKRLSFIVFVLLISACAQVVPGRPVPRFDFVSRPAVPITVANVEVVDNYTAPFAAPNVDHLFNVTLSEAVQHWVDRRLKPLGNEGTLTITIENASVVENELKRTPGVRGAFTLDQAQRYTANLVVSISGTDPMTGNMASTRVTADHSRTVGEYASIHNRDEAWVKLTEDMMRDLDLYLTKSMREKLPFLIFQ